VRPEAEGEERILLDAAVRDSEWFEQNRPAIETQYAEQYVAVKDRKIIAADKDVDVLIERLTGQGIDPALVLVTFVATKDLGIFY